MLLKEYIEQINDDDSPIFATNSISELINKAKGYDKLRVLYDDINNIFVCGDGYEFIHLDLRRAYFSSGYVKINGHISELDFILSGTNDEEMEIGNDGYTIEYNFNNTIYLYARDKNVEKTLLFNRLSSFYNKPSVSDLQRSDDLYESFTMYNMNNSNLTKLANLVYKDLPENTNIDDIEADEINFFIPDYILKMVAEDVSKKYNRVVDANDVNGKEIILSPYTKQLVIKDIIKGFKKTYNWLKDMNDEITLYRFIDLNYNKTVKSRGLVGNLNCEFDMYKQIVNNPNIHLGLCWTPDYDKAIEFAENWDLDSGAILTAKVNKDCIDLPMTMILQSYYTNYYYENEIRLIKNSPLNLESITTYSYFNGKTFKSTKSINKKYKA